MTIEVIRVSIESELDALDYPFLGSPTVLIDGVDIEPSSRGSAQNVFG